MITNPDDRMRVYDTIHALMIGRAISKKEKHRLAHRLIIALGDDKRKVEKWRSI